MYFTLKHNKRGFINDYIFIIAIICKYERKILNNIMLNLIN